MKCAGTRLPLASLRSPVSISWAIRTFTSTTSPAMVARMRMGSGMTTPFAVRWLASDGPRQDCMQRLTERRSAAAAPQGDLDLFPGEIVLAVGFHQRQNVRGLRHFHSGR